MLLMKRPAATAKESPRLAGRQPAAEEAAQQGGRSGFMPPSRAEIVGVMAVPRGGTPLPRARPLFPQPVKLKRPVREEKARESAALS
jgi:hypothetical protein